MNTESDLRVCKNKDCRKILPKVYKHKYCEACRNRHAQTAKNVLKVIGAGAATAASVAAAMIAGRKTDRKE